MKDIFPGYYRPCAIKNQELWRTGLVVLDTNVLLDLYRVPSSTREQILLLLEYLGRRLWIPHHVALEYQRNRIQVMHASRRKSQGALQRIDDGFGALLKQISDLQLEKRGVGELVERSVSNLKSAFNDLQSSAEVVLAEHLNPEGEDPVRRRLDVILEGRIGAEPSGQLSLNEVFKKGASRFSARMGPGYMDESKGKEQPTFMAGGLFYERKFGDYLLWSQLLDFSSKEDVSSVIFVTSDIKPDWWEILDGNRLGPLPELSSEIARAGVKDFAMYTLAEFLDGASEYIGFTLEATVRQDVEEIDRQSKLDLVEREVSIGRPSPEFNVAGGPLRLIAVALDGSSGQAHTDFGSASFVDVEGNEGTWYRLLVVPIAAIFAPHKSGLRVFVEKCQETLDGECIVGVVVYAGRKNFESEDELSDFSLEIASCAQLSFDKEFPLYVAARVAGALVLCEAPWRRSWEAVPGVKQYLRM
ncbi:PIN domain-containing protein [Stenotrophomonas indicatrix]|uniref:PIN domain-containing protein n=1 Tax=Stenotrophomonas indicatrix TaxID=2045451 RepID=UPI0013DFFE56|nr:PIN domain-containing protein [Stenotrophomonas indicatrix]